MEAERADSLTGEESWTPIAKLKFPAVVGCPEIMLEPELILKPAGKEPVATDQW
jgi:hypothetical protein